MSDIPLKAVLTALALPPLALVPAALAGTLLVRRGSRSGELLALSATVALLLSATPVAVGWLIASLEREVVVGAIASPGAEPAGAIVVLGAEVARSRTGPEVGALTLERLRAGAALHRATGLPLLVTAGPLAPGDPPLAALMARSLAEDFGVATRWVEAEAQDTAENAARSAALLRASGIGSVLLVTHGWHLPRAQAAFARRGIATGAAPVRLGRVPDGSRATDWIPRADQLGWTWLALREWAGRMVYALRDGKA